VERHQLREAIDVPPPAAEKTAAAPAEAPEEQIITRDAQEAVAEAKAAPVLQENEFFAGELAPGHSRLVHVDGQKVAVFNVDGTIAAMANVSFTMSVIPNHAGLYKAGTKTISSNSDGVVTVNLIRSAKYKMKMNGKEALEITIPDSATFQLPNY
jgi:hypothetical protein